MKCEKCGINEAVVFLREHTDGQLRERRLCPHCARELGLDIPEEIGTPEAETQEGEGFFAMPVAWVIAAPRPAVRRAASEPREREPSRENEKPRMRRPTPVDAALNRRRERNALRERMAQAVRTEDYAEAARLRDALRSLESETA